MTTIALPARHILTPRLEFPAWVRKIGDPLKMLSPLGGMLAPLAVNGVAANPLASAPQVAHWKFNNDANDSVGSNHLTAVNSPTFATGKLSEAAAYAAASNQYHSVADNATLSTGDVDFYVCAWVKLNSRTAYRPLVSKGDAGYGAEFYLAIHPYTYHAMWSVFKQSPRTQTVAYGTTFGALSTGTWYFLEGYHDSTNNLIGVAVNGGAFNTAAHSVGVNDSTFAFEVGRISGVGYMDGYIDSLRFFKGSGAILTSDQRAYLYNSGSGTED